MSQRSIISLYTGAGGLDLGLEAVGFRTAVAVEMDEDSVLTISANRDWRPILGDIHSVSTEQILRAARLEVGEADLLVGGPPCQPFSKSAFWVTGDTARLSDPRSSTPEQFLRVLREAQPKSFILENVPGLGYRGKDEGALLLESILRAINEDSGGRLNYVGYPAVLNAASFGVPQLRQRFFMVGHREGAAFQFPRGGFSDHTVKHSEGELFSSPANTQPYRTAWDAIGDFEDDDDERLAIGGKWARLVPSIPEGQNYLYHTPRGDGEALFGWRTRYWNFLLKLAKRLPSWTLTAQPGSATGPFHWRNRRLSIREMARLQTFPADYVFLGNYRSIQRQLGNAVPCLLAGALGLEIRKQLFGDNVTASRRRLERLIPSPKRPVPPPEAVQRVPRLYLKLRAEHDDHPGTGMGPSARMRASAT